MKFERSILIRIHNQKLPTGSAKKLYSLCRSNYISRGGLFLPHTSIENDFSLYLADVT